MVKFSETGKSYPYSHRDVVVLNDYKSFNPDDCQVYVKNSLQRNISKINGYPQGDDINWRITYEDGIVIDFLSRDVDVRFNCLTNESAKEVLDYIKAVAKVNDLGKTEELQGGILASMYSEISFIDDKTAIAPYINPQKIKVASRNLPKLIYPFGCNSSQKKAGERAFTNQLSVIQGPPGTGKTQTILNIIANIIMHGKTVMIVSNNNSATANVLEKLQKDGFGFIVAPLGCKENKETFIRNQSPLPEEIECWSDDKKECKDAYKIVKQTLEQLSKVFEQQERLAQLRLELQSVRIEWQHFKTEQKISDEDISFVETKAFHIMSLWLECQAIADEDKSTPVGAIAKLIENLKWRWKSRKIKKILNLSEIDKTNLWPIIIELQKLYYQNRLVEIPREIENIESYLRSVDAKALIEELKVKSKALFKEKLHKSYKGGDKDFIIERVKDIQLQSKKFLSRYPVVLSTTFSARTSVPDVVFDYIIMDEASQVSIETGVLALMCAKNAVIVGDSMQLPNIVTEQDKAILSDIFDNYTIDAGYNSAEYSFLESICRVVPNITQTLLREHYRCHPKIINFCNQKYYGGNLLIMTEDHDERNVVSAIKTVPGHHARGHYNQREIDVIKKEVVPNFKSGTDFGVITPYNAQVDAINAQLGGEVAATVHKYQGREKKSIIFSVVDDQITEFSDDPNLLNVAISRAENSFCLIVSGNQQERRGNITDFIEYIEYNNCSVTESKIHSVFDYLYGAYTEQRHKFLADSRKVSEYDSENLTYALINKVIDSHNEFANLGLLCHYPLRFIISDNSVMTEEERLYASRQATHLDFLIFSHVTKKPILVIETDGYSYHNDKTEQHRRDLLKNSILEKYNIPLLRLSTIDSNEEDKIITALISSLS